MIVLLLACRPCPDGLERDDAGACVSTGGPVGAGSPPTEEQFLDRYDNRVCDALEDCACDGYDSDTCEADLDCPQSVAPVDCVYDEVQAELCLSGRYECDSDPDFFTITPPSECALVFDCATATL